MSSPVTKFLEKLRSGKAISDKNDVLTFQISIIKTLDYASHKNPSISLLKQFFTNAVFELIHKEMSVNNVPITKIESLLRTGQLKEFYSLLHLSHQVTSREEYNFQSLLLPEIPDIHIFKFAEKYKQAQREHSDLDILVTSSKDIERKLTKPARDKLDYFLNQVRSMASKDGIVNGIFAKVKIGSNLLENIAAAAHSRPGCYLIKTDKSITKSFKLITRSCFPSSISSFDSHSEFSTIANSLQFNLQIYLRIVIKNNVEKEIIKKTLGLTADEVTEANIPYLIIKYESKLWKYFCNSEDYGNKLLNRLSDTEKESFYKDLLSMNDGSPCISCSPLAPKNSIDYVDISKLPVNMNVMCIKKPTLLELLVDIGVDLRWSTWKCTVL